VNNLMFSGGRINRILARNGRQGWKI